MMEITRGGKTFDLETRQPEEEPSLSHAGFALWECFCSMLHHRKEAIALWKRKRMLEKGIDSHPGHPSNREAQRRLKAIEQQFYEHQLKFVTAETYAQDYWLELLPEERVRQDYHTMFHVDPDTADITPLWHRRLGETPGAPQTCKLSSVVLAFASPATARLYTKQTRTSSSSEPEADPN